MAKLKITNNAVSRLSANISATDTSISLLPGGGAKFPTLAADEWFPVTFVKVDGAFEIVRVTARATDVLTVVRGQEATAAISFSAGDRVEHRFTAAAFTEENQRIEETAQDAKSIAEEALENAGSSVADLVATLASDAGTAEIGFKQRGTGASSRTVKDKLYEVVMVDDYEGDIPTRMERAAAEAKMIIFGKGKTYLINRDVNIDGAGVTVDARGATLTGDGVKIFMNNPAESNWLGGNLNNIKIPWSIIRDSSTWAEQTIADVTQSNDGYIPGGLDSDITPFLPTDKADWNKTIGIQLVFRSTGSTPQKNINVSDFGGRFTNLIFEGCTDVTVSNPKFKPGFEFGGIIFYNDVSVQRDPTFTDVFPPLGFTYARGYRNKVVNHNIDGGNLAGVVFYGNDDFLVMGGETRNGGESGVKTYQNDTHFGPSVICRYGKVIACTSDYNRFDGYDLSATYPATGTQSGHNHLIGCTAKGNRSTGVYSDAQSNTYIGNEISDNGTFGMRIAGANSIVKSNTLENNVKFPGMLGLTNVQDLSLEGDNIESSDNTIRRVSPPAYTYAYLHIGTGGYSNDNSIPFPVSIDSRVSVNVTPSNDRITQVPTAFAAYFRTLEPASVQSVIKVHRAASEGVMVDILYGPTETRVGMISSTSANTNYGTTSDYRLKVDPIPLEGYQERFSKFAETLCQWSWRESGTPGRGSLAHKFQEIYPEGTTGEKDAVTADGKVDPQAIDISYAIPDIAATLYKLQRDFEQYKKEHP